MRLNKHSNPFSLMDEAEWKKYSTELHPHFTEEPYFEVVSWPVVKARIEDNAKEAGFSLILRTTNNKCYCPDHEDHEWNQQTQWLFGYPDKRIIIHIVYAEHAKEIKNKDTWQNYVSIDVHIELPLHKAPIAPDGYVSNGGMVKPGITEYHYYMIEGKKSRFYEDLQKTYVHPGYNNVLEREITPTFFGEWLQRNPFIIAGTIEDIHMWSYSDTFDFPGRKQSAVLSLYMDYLFLQRLLKSNMSQFVSQPWSFQCMHTLSPQFWILNGMRAPSSESGIHLLEGKFEEAWYPISNKGFYTTLTCKEVRVNPVVQKIIDEDISRITFY